MLKTRARLALRMMLNSLTAAGRRRNARLRREWPWLIASREAVRSGKDLHCALHGDMTLIVSPHDGVVGKAVFLTGTWEPAEVAFIRRFVRPGMTVLDIGANVGAHTLLLSKCVGAQGCVHAFEPSAAGDYLARSLEINRIENVAFHPIALGSEPGTLRLVKCKPGTEAFTSIGTPLNTSAADGYIDAPVERLDDYVERAGIGAIGFAKMDVEGAEILVLEGAKRLLASRQAAAWLFEVNAVCLTNAGFSAEQLEGLFENAGYHLFLLNDEGWPAPFERAQVKKNRDVIALTADVLEQMRRADGPWGETFCAALGEAA